MSFPVASSQLVLAVWLTLASVAAQSPFADLARRGLPRDLQSVTAAVFGDVDGDGDVDLIQGIDALFPSGSARVLINDGAGHLEVPASIRIPSPWMSPAALVLGDLDGDGDLDLVVGNRSNLQNLLLINDGSGRFSDATATHLPTVFDDTQSLVLFDAEGDGDLDLVVGNDQQRNSLLINDGSGRFSAGTPLSTQNTDQSLGLAFGDFDGDGDVDLVTANNSGQNRLLFNDGSGNFVDVTAQRFPVDADPSSAVVSVDVDADSDLDLVFANFNKPGLLYLNDGSGRFTKVTIPALADAPPVVALSSCDLDGDQDMDLIVGIWGAPNRLLINDGKGVFATRALSSGQDSTEVVLTADIDGDGDEDLFVGNSYSVFVPSRSALYLNDGGQFLDTAMGRLPVDTDASEAVVWGDINGDGALDLVIANAETRNRVYMGWFGGFFYDDSVRALPVDMDRSRAAALGDVDGDGDLDLIIGNELQDRLYLNDGSGKFSDATSALMPVMTGDTRDCVLGDVDGDGDLDLVLALRGLTPTQAQQNRLYLNDGSGRFTDVTVAKLPLFPDFTEAVSLGDVDGDGDLDIVFGNRDIGLPSSPQFNRLLHNDGRGKFFDVSITQMPLKVAPTTDIALVDVDADGDLDMIVSNWILADSLYMNENGVFRDRTLGRFPIVSDRSCSVAFGDIDEDGDQDLLFGVCDGIDAIYWNDGTGRFQAANSGAFQFSATAQVALVDVDADGDLDCLAIHGAQQQNRVFLNTRRQLDGPHVPIRGGELRFEVLVAPVTGGAPRSVLPWIGLGRIATPIVVPPFGRFTIDPATIVALPVLTLPANQGRAISALPLPQLSALKGLTILGQAAVWHSGPNSGRVTNTVSLTIH